METIDNTRVKLDNKKPTNSSSWGRYILYDAFRKDYARCMYNKTCNIEKIVKSEQEQCKL